MRFPGFAKVPTPAPPPAPVTRDDPAIADAKNKSRQATLKRRGRAASILTKPDDLGTANVARPEAQNLGGTA